MNSAIVNRGIVTLAATMCLSGQAFAQANEIVDTAHVAKAIKNGAIVWDVRGAGAYKAGHVPGAYLFSALKSVSSRLPDR